MNASVIINESMTLEEKLAAIDAALADASYTEKRTVDDMGYVITDPANLLICEGCQ